MCVYCFSVILIPELFSSFCFMNFLRDRCHPPTRGASWTSFPIQKKLGLFSRIPISRHWSVCHYVSRRGRQREHAICHYVKLHHRHEINNVALSHETGTSQPAAQHDGAMTHHADQEAPSLRVFYSVRLTWRSHTLDEVQDTACMVDHACMLTRTLHARWTMHACLIMPDS